MDVLFFRSKGNRRKIQRVLGLLVRGAQDSSFSGRQRFKVKSRIDPESVFREVKGIRPASILRLHFGTYLRRRANTLKTAKKSADSILSQVKMSGFSSVSRIGIGFIN